ncbi:MAG TPA: ABC transporter permease subunit [Patescibacteria group bacterium]|nr:ABC transporter permease subunit [Patescibacteria group bacterium]
MRRPDPWLVAGAILCGVLLFVAAYGDRLAPNEPVFLMVNGPAGTERPLPPGEPFVFGSDAVGRDLFSLVLVGARTTLLIVVLAGAARLAAGLGFAIVASWLRPLRLLVDAAADIASSVPSTIVAVFAVLVFARQGAPAFVFGSALLVTGWAGPYRVVRAELARLRAAPYTEGAVALGVSRRRLFVRHHLPHLVPVLALTASQQIAAALIALAELGVIGIFVGPTRSLNLAEAMRVVPAGIGTTFPVPDLPEWGGLLALGRGLQNLYVTRWAFLVPGVAIAFAAIAVTLLGVGIARQYRRRNLLHDLATRRALLVAVIIVAIVAPSFVLPSPHAAAVELGDTARSRAVVGTDPGSVLAEAHLAVTPVDLTNTRVQKVGGAVLQVDTPTGRAQFAEGAGADFTALLFGGSGGGTVDAPLVFMGWGVSPADFPRQQVSVFSAGDFGTAVSDWQDDYERVDVRGKVALVLRLPFIRTGRSAVLAPTADTLIASALKRGAAAVLWVDPNRDQIIARGQPDPYRRLETDDPITKIAGQPVFLVSAAVADQLLAPISIRATDILRAQAQGDVSATDGRSMAQELPERAHLELSIAAVTAASAGVHRLVIWAVAPSAATGSRSAADVLSALVRALAGRVPPPLAFVLFDPRGDPAANAKAVRAVLGSTPIDDVVTIESLGGTSLRFATVYADLVPAIDDYAARVGARAARTARVLDPAALATGDLMRSAGLTPFTDDHWLVISGQGPVTDDGELREDAAAVVGYIVARYAERAPELIR